MPEPEIDAPQSGGGPDDSGPERPGSGGTTPGVGGSHGAASDGISGYRGAGDSNAWNVVSGNPDKTSYSGTAADAASPGNPTVYRDPSMDPAARIEAAELREVDAAARTQAVDPAGNDPVERLSGAPHPSVDPAQHETSPSGTPPVPTLDPTVGTSGFMDPDGAKRAL